MHYELKQGSLSDLPQVYKIIDDRIHWMDAVGIRQWNVTTTGSVIRRVIMRRPSMTARCMC